MHDLIVEFEPHVRLSAFPGVFVLVAPWEIAAPHRIQSALVGPVVRDPSGPQPTAGHERMTIGLEQFRDPHRQWLWHMPALPFTGSGGGNSRGWRRGEGANR